MFFFPNCYPQVAGITAAALTPFTVQQLEARNRMKITRTPKISNTHTPQNEELKTENDLLIE